MVGEKMVVPLYVVRKLAWEIHNPGSFVQPFSLVRRKLPPATPLSSRSLPEHLLHTSYANYSVIVPYLDGPPWLLGPFLSFSFYRGYLYWR
jgi:hypothetical protein